MNSVIDPLNPPKEKKCKVCKQVKPIKRFKKNGKMKDNRENTCLDCYREKIKAAANKDQLYREEYFDFQEEPF